MARGPVEMISRWHHLVENFSTSALDFYAAVEVALAAREIPGISRSRVEFKEGAIGSAKREYLRVGRERLAFDICAAPYGRGFFFSWWLTRLGPSHPLLWLVGFILLFMVWSLLLVNLMTRAVAASAFGASGSSGCLFLFVLAGLPVGLGLLGWSIREGYVPIGEEDVLGVPVIGWLYERLFQPLTYYRFDTALMFQESVRRAVNEVIESLLSARGLRALTDEQKRPTIRDLAR